MGTVQRAAVGGLAGTIAMGSLLVLLEVQMRARLLLFDAVARFFQVPGRADLGVVLAGLFGVVVWPPIFAAVEPYLPPEDPAVSGMVFAAGLSRLRGAGHHRGVRGPPPAVPDRDASRPPRVRLYPRLGVRMDPGVGGRRPRP